MSSGHLTPPVSAHDHARGPADAPITLVEYGDYECPYCGQAYPIVEAIRQRLGPRLRFVFRNFPLSEAHPHAAHAAEAAEAVGAIGGNDAFWKMHDTLYENQDALDDRALVSYASALEIDPREIARDLEDGTYEPRVRADFRSGVRSGVNGTPTFFIGGERYDGSWADPDQFLAALVAATGAPA